MRIPESNIETSIGATPSPVAAQSSGNEVAKAFSSLGDVGTKMFDDLIDKRGTAEYLDFVSEYNTTMEGKKAELRKKMLNMNADGSYKDEQGNVIGHIEDDYRDFVTSRSEFEQRGEGLQKSLKAKEYFSTVRAQDGIQLGLEIEKTKARAAKKETVGTVTELTELFANATMKGTATPKMLNEYMTMMKDATHVLGEEDSERMMENFTTTALRAMGDFVSENGRTDNANRMIASIGAAMPEWKRERFEMALQESEKKFNRNVISGLTNITSKLEDSTKDVTAWAKSRQNAVATVEKPLRAMSSNIEGLNPEEMYSLATAGMAHSAVAEGYFLKNSVFAKSDDPGMLETLNGYLGESADKLIKNGSLPADKREDFINKSLEQSKQILDKNYEMVSGPSKAAFIASWDQTVAESIKQGNYSTAVEQMSSIYEQNNIPAEQQNFVNQTLIDQENKALKSARELDGKTNGTGLAESASLIQRVSQFGDKYFDVASRLAGNGSYPAYAPLAGHLVGSSLLQEISSADQRVAGLIKDNPEARKNYKEIQSSTNNIIKSLGVPVTGNGDRAYINAFSSAVSSLAIGYMYNPKHGISDRETAVRTATNKILNEFVIAPSKGGVGVVYSKKELADPKVGIDNKDSVREFVSDINRVVNSVEQVSGKIDKAKFVDLVSLRPDMANDVATFKAEADSKGLSAQKKAEFIFDRFKSSLSVTRVPNSKDMQLGINTRTGFVALPLETGKLSDIPLNNLKIYMSARKSDAFTKAVDSGALNTRDLSL